MNKEELAASILNVASGTVVQYANETECIVVNGEPWGVPDSFTLNRLASGIKINSNIPLIPTRNFESGACLARVFGGGPEVFLINGGTKDHLETFSHWKSSEVILLPASLLENFPIGVSIK